MIKAIIMKGKHTVTGGWERHWYLSQEEWISWTTESEQSDRVY